MFRSLFGKGKKKGESDGQDETIRSARVGDVVVVSGYAPLLEDAYFIVESRNRYEGPAGKWYELIAVEGDERVSIDWSDEDGIFITVTKHNSQMGLAALDLEHDDMVRLDDEHSIDNHITFEDEQFFYRNSFEATFHKNDGTDGDGFYMWEFGGEKEERMISVSKYEGMPFEAYTSDIIAPDRVSVYKK